MVELGLAGLVLALVMLPMIGLLRYSVKGTTESLHLTRAFQMARSAVDAMETFAYEDLDDAKAQALVAQLPVPTGVEAPSLKPLELVEETSKNGERVSAKVVAVTVGYDKAEGLGGRGEVVLKALVIRAR